MVDKSSVTLGGTVEKIVESPGQPELVQIVIDGADAKHNQLRMENSFTGKDGEKVSLKKDSEVQVTFEADTASTKPE